LNDAAIKADKGQHEYELQSKNEGVTTGRLTSFAMEVDPAKMSDDASDAAVNTLQLWLTAQKLFQTIINSQNTIPSPIRDIVRHVKSELESSNFGDLVQLRGMGAFFFLRMICPCLLTPHTYGLLEENPHPICQRQLVLLAKVMQNLANNTLPGTKEDFMKKLNDFISSNAEKLTEFYGTLIANTDGNEGLITEISIPDDVRHEALTQVLNFIVEHREELPLDNLDHELREALEDILNDSGNEQLSGSKRKKSTKKY